MPDPKPPAMAWCEVCFSAVVAEAIGDHLGGGYSADGVRTANCPGSGREIVYVPAGARETVAIIEDGKLVMLNADIEKGRHELVRRESLGKVADIRITRDERRTAARRAWAKRRKSR